MLDINDDGTLVAEYRGWKIRTNQTSDATYKFIASNDGQVETGDSINEVVQQIASRVGELSNKEGAWSGGISSDH